MIKLFDQVRLPNGKVGEVLILIGYPQVNEVYVDVQKKAEEGFEYIQLYDATLGDTVVKSLNRYKASDVIFLAHSATAHQIEVGDLIIDKQKNTVRYKGELKKLTKKEFEILVLLASKPDIVISRKEISESVWGRNTDETTVNVHICKLRKYIDKILTVPSKGYKYDAT